MVLKFPSLPCHVIKHTEGERIEPAGPLNIPLYAEISMATTQSNFVGRELLTDVTYAHHNYRKGHSHLILQCQGFFGLKRTPSFNIENRC